MTTEEQILKGSQELFFRYGIKGITMDDVAKHLAMSKRTIYEKFPNKDAIVELLMKQHLDRHLEDLKKFRQSSANAIEEVFMTLQPIKELFQAMNPRLMFELKKFHPETWQQFQKFKRKALKDTLVANMKRGIKEDLYRADIDIEVLAILRLEEVEIASNDEIYPPSEYNVVRVQVAMLEHFLFGIASAKGHSLAEKYKKQLHING